MKPCEKARAEAKKNPGGWVYAIRGDYGAYDDVPPQAVVGAWKVNLKGEIVGDFIPNPNFQEDQPDKAEGPGGGEKVSGRRKGVRMI